MICEVRMKYEIGVLALIALCLLVADRYLRINPMLKSSCNTCGKEGFTLNTGTKPRSSRCGVDLFPCPNNEFCGNGQCISQNMTMPVEAHPLPVFP